MPSYNKPNLKDFLKTKKDYWKNREVPPGTRRVLLADGRTSYVSSAASMGTSGVMITYSGGNDEQSTSRF